MHTQSDLHKQLEDSKGSARTFEKVVYFGRDISFGEFYNKLDIQDKKYH